MTRRILIIVVLLCAGALAWWMPRTLIRDASAYLLARSPHERYAALLRLQGEGRTANGSSWLSASETSLAAPRDARAPFSDAGAFDGTAPSAAAWQLSVRRGHRVVVDVAFDGGPIFIDLFRAAGLDHVASAARGETRLVHDVEQDMDLVLRVQPELHGGGAYRLEQRSEASMAFPVQGLTPRAVQSGFGASREDGRRTHEGVDIFAKKGTPVVAALDGWVGGSTVNGLGGNVVWVWSPFRGVRTYYAHLDQHAVSPGSRVIAGDVVGYVGTTGNARGGPPHLHFGVYATGAGSVDPLPYICDAPCGARR